MHTLAITRDFIARHFLIGGDWGAENQLHSHHYRLEIRVAGQELDGHGYLIDIVDLERVVGEVIDRVREQVLNELPECSGLNPSIERVSRILWADLTGRLNLEGQRLVVRLWENETDWAEYTE